MEWKEFLTRLIEYMGFSDFRVEVDEEHRHSAVFIHESEMFVKENLPIIVENLNRVIQLVARKNGTQPIFLDVNNYRKEREALLAELARAAARRAAATRQPVSLPAMNPYERRITHLVLVAHPDVTTESVGEGKGRYVVVKPLTEGTGVGIENEKKQDAREGTKTTPSLNPQS